MQKKMSHLCKKKEVSLRKSRPFQSINLLLLVPFFRYDPSESRESPCITTCVCACAQISASLHHDGNRKHPGKLKSGFLIAACARESGAGNVPTAFNGTLNPEFSSVNRRVAAARIPSTTTSCISFTAAPWNPNQLDAGNWCWNPPQHRHTKCTLHYGIS